MKCQTMCAYLFYLFGAYTAAKSDHAFGKLNIFRKQFYTFFGSSVFGAFWRFLFLSLAFLFGNGEPNAFVRSLLFMLIACFVRVMLRFFVSF